MSAQHHRPRQGTGALAPAALALLLAASPTAVRPAAAQSCPLARGCTRTQHERLWFQTADQSIWGPGQASFDGTTVTLFDDSWDESASAPASIQTIDLYYQNLYFGGGFDAEDHGNVGMWLNFPGAAGGRVAVDYPIEAWVTLPEPNSFARGETIPIRTRWAVVSDSVDLHSTAVDLGVAIGWKMAAGASASGKLCLFDCTPNFQIMDVDFDSGDQTLLELNNTGAESPWDFAWDNLPHTFNPVESALLGLDGTFGVPAPSVDGGLASDGVTVTGTSTNPYVDLEIDLDKQARFVPGLSTAPLSEVNLDLSAIGTDVAFGWTTLDYQVFLKLTMEQSFRLDPTFDVTMDLGAVMDWTVVDADGNPTGETGSGATVTVPLGYGVDLAFPDTTTPVPLGPTFQLHNTFSTQLDNVYESRYGNRAGDFKLHYPSAHWSGNDRKSVHHDAEYDWVSCSSIIDAGSAGEFFNLVAKCVAGTISGTWKKVKDAWDELVDYVATGVFDGADVSAGPLLEYTVPIEQVTDTLYPKTEWELGGFDPLAGSTLLLDPENPVIAIASSLANTGLTTGMDYGTVTQTLVVENQGDVPLNAASIIDAVSPTGLAANLIESVDITVDGAFDGMGQPETLGAGQTLPVGGSATVTIRWAATPGTHGLTILAGGTSPIGTLVEDDAESAFAWAAMAIRDHEDDDHHGHDGEPHLPTLNRRSHGVTPIRILGSDALDVRDIDRPSLAVEGVAPRRIHSGDFNDDGIRDLMLQVPTRELLAALDARVAGYPAPPAVALDIPAGDDGEAPIVAVPADRVAAALLGEAGASDADRAAMDAAGNRNGRLDVGDLRAALYGTPAGRDGAATVATDRGRHGGRSVHGDHGDHEDHGRGDHAGPPPGDVRTLVLTGTLDDGTPLWAEDTARITGEAR